MKNEEYSLNGFFFFLFVGDIYQHEIANIGFVIFHLQKRNATKSHAAFQN